MVSLPRGVGVLRIQFSDGPMCLVSERLTPEEQRVGRLIAAAVCRRPDYPSVVLVQEEEIHRAISEAHAAILLMSRPRAS